MTDSLFYYWDAFMAWLLSMAPFFATLVVAVIILGIMSFFFYVMGVYRLLKQAVSLYLENHDPKPAQRRRRHGA